MQVCWRIVQLLMRILYSLIQSLLSSNKYFNFQNVAECEEEIDINNYLPNFVESK